MKEQDDDRSGTPFGLWLFGFVVMGVGVSFLFSAHNQLRKEVDALKANVRTLMEDKERAMVAETIREHLVITPKEPDNERK